MIFIRGKDCPRAVHQGTKKGEKAMDYKEVFGRTNCIPGHFTYGEKKSGHKFNIIHSEPFYHPGIGRKFSGKMECRKYMNANGITEVGTEDIRSEKHRGMSARDIKAKYHPDLV